MGGRSSAKSVEYRFVLCETSFYFKVYLLQEMRTSSQISFTHLELKVGEEFFLLGYG